VRHASNRGHGESQRSQRAHDRRARQFPRHRSSSSVLGTSECVKHVSGRGERGVN
jgi:hypothetical protein